MKNRRERSEAMSRSTIQAGGREYKLWVVVECEAKKGFPQDIVDRLETLKNNPKAAKHVKKAESDRIIVDVRLFDMLQIRLDMVPRCYCSLVGEDLKTGKMRIIRKDAKMFGPDKSDYDEILRMLRMVTF